MNSSYHSRDLNLSGNTSLVIAITEPVYFFLASGFGTVCIVTDSKQLCADQIIPRGGNKALAEGIDLMMQDDDSNVIYAIAKLR